MFATNPEFRGLTGFVHAEDHYWDGESLTGHGKAYKSISLGNSFTKHFNKILTIKSVAMNLAKAGKDKIKF